jgi:hypothetical protein
MNSELLIQSIVQQTTVLLAQLSTAAGVRAPLAHVANQVFLDLARELERQGVRRNVVADMFGLALRSYQLKVQRLADAAEVQRSVWQDVHSLLGEGSITRKQLVERLPGVDAKSISAVLNDLVDSGLAYASGRGSRAIYGLTPERDVEVLMREDDEVSLAHMLWLHLATRGACSTGGLATEMRVSAERIEAALKHLLDASRVELRGTQVHALSLDIPVGAEMGWEAAVSDHFRAVASAIAAKLADPGSRRADRIGGTTLSFTVYDEHPNAAEIYGLLRRFRAELDALWEQASAYNQSHPVPDGADRVTFYFGQNVTAGAGASASLDEAEAKRTES